MGCTQHAICAASDVLVHGARKSDSNMWLSITHTIRPLGSATLLVWLWLPLATTTEVT